MKLKWYTTPGGMVRILFVVVLLAGGAALEGKIPSYITNLMLVGGVGLLIYRYLLTFLNIRRINK